MIGDAEMIEALGRWKDFETVGVGETSGLPQEEIDEKVADALRAQGEGLGLTPEAKRAFWLGIGSFLKHLGPPLTPENLETAAYMGLVIGLMAREQASEAEEKQRQKA